MNNTPNWIDRLLRIVPMGPGFVVLIGTRCVDRVDRKITAELIVKRLRAEFRRRNGGDA